MRPPSPRCHGSSSTTSANPITSSCRRTRPSFAISRSRRRIKPLTVTGPLRILGMVASPTGLTPLDVERERSRINEATAALQADGRVEVHWLDPATPRELQAALRRDKWHIFHFAGHGGFDPTIDEGVVALVDEDGAAVRVPATQLGRLLGDHNPLRLAVLNACEGARGSTHDLFSSTAATLVRRGTPAVVAMQYEITDDAAKEFGRSFYEAVADGSPVDIAVAEARKSLSIQMSSTLEWGTPVLFMRTDDGVLFRMRRSKAKTAVESVAAATAATVAPTAASEAVTAATPRCSCRGVIGRLERRSRRLRWRALRDQRRGRSRRRRRTKPGMQEPAYPLARLWQQRRRRRPLRPALTRPQGRARVA